MLTTNHFDEGLSVSRAPAESESPSKKDSATEKKVNKNSKVEEAKETEVVQGNAGAREAGRCDYPGAGLVLTAEERATADAWKRLPRETCPRCIDGQCWRDTGILGAHSVAICSHQIVTVGNKRQCIKSYDAGGCGAHWSRADEDAPWVFDGTEMHDWIRGQA